MLNNVILMGRLTADPELKTTASNISVVPFTLAVERNFADKQSGQRQTDFIDIVAWRNTADFVARYFRKGQLVAVQGSLQTRSYEDKNGNKRKAIEVIAENCYFAEPKRETERHTGGYEPPPAAPESSLSIGTDDDFVPLSDDDLPF